MEAGTNSGGIMKTISVPAIVWVPAVTWFVTYELTKYGGPKKWLKKFTDFYR